MRILILGGYGVFGGRLARLLADEAGLTLLIAGRARDKAARFCADLPARATLLPVVFDRDGDVAQQMATADADMVIDATGPFQVYGDDPYRVVKAALALRIDYMDFADGSDFVHGVAQFDDAARMAEIFVLSGVSSFPVLSGAVVRHLGGGLACLETIAGGIAPSPYAGVGRNVIAAISSYAGKPVLLVRDGAPVIGRGLVETMRYTVAPPGMMPLGSIRFSLVDVPDLQVLPPRWPGLRSIWMGAGPVPEILHRGLNLMAWLVRLKLLPTLLPFVGLFHWAINTFRWGEHRGGMFIEVTGRTPEGRSVTRSWHLLAEGDDGPLIPSMALEALVRKTLAGARRQNGARPAVADLELTDYDALFARHTIFTGIRADDELPPDAPLYHRLLGAAWDDLAAPVRDLHSTGGSLVATGVARVERGRNPLARMVAALFRFPKSGGTVPVRVEITARDGVETWTRDFAGRRFTSTQRAGRCGCDRLLDERFGPFRFGLALVRDGDRLSLIPRRWTLMRLPMPRFLMPRGESYETVEDGRFRFHVEIRLPLAGLIVRYQGWLARDK